MAAPSRTPARALVTAVRADESFLGPGAALAFRRVHDSGATAIRLQLPWRNVAQSRPAQPREPADPAYVWTSFDDQVRLAQRYGLEPIVTLEAAPLWARAPGGNAPRVAELQAFAWAAAERYSGRSGGLPRVRYWQVWNEPNITIYLTPQFRGTQLVAPVIYRGMVNAVARSVHGVNATNVVIAGGTSPFTVRAPNLRAVGPLRFMRKALCMSAGARARPTCSARIEFDVWAHHPYTSGGPTHQAANPDDVSLGDLPEMRRLLDAGVRAHHVVSRGGARLWVTEFSWDTNPPDPLALPIRLQARWTAEALYRMWSAGVDLVTWNALRDGRYPEDAVQSGLWFRGAALVADRPKPTLAAFKFPFVAYRRPGGIFIWGRTPWGKAGTVRVEATGGGGWRRLTTLRGNRYGIFSRLVPTSSRPQFLRARLPSGATTLSFSLREPPDRQVRPFG